MKICKQGQCRFKNGLLDNKPYRGPIYKITSFIWVKQGDDNALMEVLENYGPVSVAIDASHYSFTIYHNFIFGSVPNICNSRSIGFVIFFYF